MAEGSDHGAHPEGGNGTSYLGLISVLIVILSFIAILLYLGVGPLGEQEAGLAPGAHSDTPAPPGEATPSTRPLESDASAALPSADKVLTRIAFGSCLDENESMEILSAIRTRVPQLFIMEGDNVYADTSSRDGGAISSPLLIRTAYATLASRPEFQSFRAEVPLIATWDDHDFGLNDAGSDFAFKQASKEAFFDFFKLDRTSERYERPDGIYTSYTFGPEGRRVQIILLDTRWNRSELLPSDAPGTPGIERFMPDRDPEKTMLGEAQWNWLEQQLIEPAEVRLIVSSIQVLADGHGWERWGNLPRERDRLLQMLNDTGANGVVLLSGDRHVGAIYKNDNALPYSLFEVTSSSLNKPLSAMGAQPSENEVDPQRIDALYPDANFGVVEIDWEARAVFLELRDKAGELVQSASFPLAAQDAVIQ